MAKRYLVPAIKRAFDVLELLSTRPEGNGISEIRRALRLPLSSVATIVYTLTDLGFLERDERTSRYRLSAKLLGIGRRVLDQTSLVSQCHDLLCELVQETKLTGHLAVLRNTDSLYVDRVQGTGWVQFQSYVGMTWPAHTSAVGKALLAFQANAELRRLMRGLRMAKLTPFTITSKAALNKQLTQIRRMGYASELNEGEMGLGCVAAPLYDHRHHVTAALSLTGTVHQLEQANLASLGVLVMAYAQRMSARLGDSPRPKVERTSLRSDGRLVSTRSPQARVALFK